MRATLPTAALESARFDAARGALSADAPSYVVVGLDSGKYVLLSHVPPTSQVQNRGARVGKGEYKNLKQNNLAEKIIDPGKENDSLRCDHTGLVPL